MITHYNFGLSFDYIKRVIDASISDKVTSASPYPRGTSKNIIVEGDKEEIEYVFPSIKLPVSILLQFKQEFFLKKDFLFNENFNETKKDFIKRDFAVEEEWFALVLRPTNRWSAYYLKGSPNNTDSETVFTVGAEIALEHIRFFEIADRKINFFNKKEVMKNEEYKIKHWFDNQKIDFVTIPINDLVVMSSDFKAVAFKGDTDEEPTGEIVSSINGYAFVDKNGNMTVNKIDALPCPPNWRPQSKK